MGSLRTFTQYTAGACYTPKKMSIVFSITKENMLLDLNAKYAKIR